MQVSLSGNAEFTGTFVKWQYQPGQKYIQLLFETASGMRLSLSRSKDLARSLTVGRKYRIKGEEYSVGGKTFVREPVAIPVETKASHKKRAVIAVIAALLAIGIVAGYFVFSGNDSPKTNTAETNKSATADNKPSTSAVLGASATAVTPTSTTEEETPVVRPATTSPVKTTPKKTTVTPPVAPAPSPASLPAVQPQVPDPTVDTQIPPPPPPPPAPVEVPVDPPVSPTPPPPAPVVVPADPAP